MIFNRMEYPGLSSLFLVVFCICLLIGCQSDELDQGDVPEEENTNDIPNKIMPLGASRVQGFTPWFESYRYALWRDLIDGDGTLTTSEQKRKRALIPIIRAFLLTLIIRVK